MTYKEVVEVIEKFKQYHASKGIIFLDEFPNAVKDDFIRFLHGKTLGKKNGKIYSYYHDFNSWLREK